MTRRNSRDYADRLWEAMTLAFPIVARNGQTHAPEGTAQLAREYAEALLAEWRRSLAS